MKFLKKHLRKYRNRVIQSRLSNSNRGGSNKFVTIFGLLLLSALSFFSLLKNPLNNNNSNTDDDIGFWMENSGRSSSRILEEGKGEKDEIVSEDDRTDFTLLQDETTAVQVGRQQTADNQEINAETNPIRTSAEEGRTLTSGITTPTAAAARPTENISKNNVNNKKSEVIVISAGQDEGDQGLNTVECQIDEYHGLMEEDEGQASADFATPDGSKKPVVIRNAWTPPNDEDWTTREGFLERFGDTPFYIKNNVVQVQDQENCIAPFRDLWQYVTGTSGNSDSINDNSNNVIINNNKQANDTKKIKRSMLVFTNDMENPAFFGKDGNQLNYDVPPPVRHIDSFTVVSTMTKGQSHEFHHHGESWIGQAAGHKVWWFLPPNGKKPKKVNACDYLTGKARPPNGTKTCIQSPGDVIWFPHNWYHATCSLTDWNVALGRQLGPRINQKFKTLPMEVGPEKLGSMQQTLQKCSQSKSGKKKTPKKRNPSTILRSATSNKMVESRNKLPKKQYTGKH